MSTRNTVHFTTRSSELAAAASTAFTFSRAWCVRSEEHTSELQSRSDLVCRLLLEKKKKKNHLPKSLKPHTLILFAISLHVRQLLLHNTTSTELKERVLGSPIALHRCNISFLLTLY